MRTLEKKKRQDSYAVAIPVIVFFGVSLLMVGMFI